jgi:hypothetical protein
MFYDVCVVGNVRNNCNYSRQLNAGFYWEIKDDDGNAIFRVTNDTQELTNVRLNGASSGNTIILTEEDHWDVAACQDTTAQAIFNLPTTNAPTPVCEGSNTRLATLDFNDTTDQSFSARLILPTGYQSTPGIDVHFRWKAASTSGTVMWCARFARVAVGSTSDPSLPSETTSSCVSDTANGSTLTENTTTIASVACTSCAAGDAVNVVVSRDANGTSGTDSMTGDAKLMNWGRTWTVAH